MIANSPLDKARRYQAIKLRLFLLSTVSELLALVALLFSGLSHEMRSWATRLTSVAPFQVLIYFLILGAAGQVLSFPLDYIRGHWIERRYDLSNRTLKGWLWDWSKALAVTAILGLIMVQIVYALLRFSENHWWWITALIFAGWVVLLTQLAPVVLLPIFYKYRPLEREDLRQRLIQLAQRCGCPVLDVFELALSEKTKAANAALAGWGRTRRILLGDTLLNHYTPDEIEAVLAHELAHHRYHHLRKGILIECGFILLGFFLADNFLQMSLAPLDFRSKADLAAFPVMGLSFAVLAGILLPLVNGISRRYEFQADRFAAQLTGAEPLISALQKLALQNLSDPEPPRWAEFLFYSHPAIGKRLETLKKGQLDHTKEAQ